MTKSEEVQFLNNMQQHYFEGGVYSKHREYLNQLFSSVGLLVADTLSSRVWICSVNIV